MKLKIKQIAILLFSLMLIACNNTTTENKTSNEKTSTALTSENDSTIVIAQINGASISFVADSTTLRNDWETFINNQGSDPCVLDHIEIMADASNTKYYLVVTGTRNSEALKSALELEQGGPTCWMVSGFTVTCETTACALEQLGCVPNLLACTACSNGGKCKKTVVNNAVAIFPSIAPSVCQN